MAIDGWVRIEPGPILATVQGRLLLRKIAMCFDRYLDRPGVPLRFSGAIYSFEQAAREPARLPALGCAHRRR